MSRICDSNDRKREREREIFLSGEAEEIGESIVPIVEPMGGPVAGLTLLARVDFLLRWHVFLAAYTEVALDRAATHRTPIEFAKARGTNAGVSAR